jgi:flagellar protein FlbD
MISLTRLNGAGFVLNAGLIERLETTPDTVVTLVNGDKHVVKEDVQTVIALTRAWHAEIFHTIVTVDGEQAATSPLHLVPDGERG